MATITFPNTDTIFAFNRYVAKVSEADAGDRYIMRVRRVDSTEVIYQDNRVADSNGDIDFSFGYYLRLLFNLADVVAGEQSVQVYIQVGQAQGRFTDFAPTAYWGAISAGERLGDRTLRYYPSLDNPLPTWLISGMFTLVQSDNNEAIERGTSATTSIYDMRDYFLEQGVGTPKNELVLMQVLTEKSASTFDDTFDYTFWAFGKGDILRTRVIVDCGTEGVYLKWIDPQGCWYYWLFEPFTKTYKTKAIGDAYETFTEGEYAGYYGALRPQGYTQENTQTIVAPMVSREERRVLETILASPLVFWCPDVESIASGELTNDTAEWLPVRIVAGSTKDDLSDLSDFEIDVQYPNKNVQVL